jgi:hypothetical protein
VATRSPTPCDDQPARGDDQKPKTPSIDTPKLTTLVGDTAPPPGTAFASAYQYLLKDKAWGTPWEKCVNELLKFERARGFPDVRIQLNDYDEH